MPVMLALETTRGRSIYRDVIVFSGEQPLAALSLDASRMRSSSCTLLVTGADFDMLERTFVSDDP